MSFAYLPEVDEATKMKFQIPKLPFILGVQIDPNLDADKMDLDHPQVPVRIQPYSGPSKFPNMAAWLAGYGTASGAQPSGNAVRM